MAKCVIFCLVWAVISSSTNVRGGGIPPCETAKTISNRCKFTTSPSSCIHSSAIDSTSQLPDGHFCENGENSYAECNKSCFNDDDSPTEFTGPDDPTLMFCKSVPMPCKFPFTHNGVQHNECTNDKLLKDTTNSEEDFFWCATHTDSDHNMMWWGQCDMSECEIDTTEASEPASLDTTISAIVNILPESNALGISGTIDFSQQSQDKPLSIQGKVIGLPTGKHGFHVHENKLVGTDCGSAGRHFNPEDVDHGSAISETRHAGDFGNIEADVNGTAKIDIIITRGSTLFGEQNILDKTLVIHKLEDDLGKLHGSTLETNAESKKTGNAGERIACGVIMRKEDPNQTSMMTIIIIVLVVIIVLLLILITALIVYCCKRKGQVSKGKGDDVGPFQNGDMKKKPLEYDELSIPFIDASPAPTPKVGRSTERLSFFNRTPSIGRSRGSLSSSR